MGKDKGSLGRALVKDRFGASKGKKKVDGGSMLHTTEVQDGYDWGRLNLQSVTEESSFQEFLSTAQLAGTEFQAEKLNLKLVHIGGAEALSSSEARAKAEKKQAESKHLLRVPRRPSWNREMTAEQLSENEKQAFLEWRRDLALLQEKDGIIMTPYEKNLEFWRQLWRVLERSELLVQVIDARNPLLFRCQDLESYAKNIGIKGLLLLLNKADLLTQRQRELWADYFDQQGVQVAFFSAVLASEEIKIQRKKETDSLVEGSDEDQEEESDEEEDDDGNGQGSKLSTVDDVLKGINNLNVAVDKTEERLRRITEQFQEIAENNSTNTTSLSTGEISEVSQKESANTESSNAQNDIENIANNQNSGSAIKSVTFNLNSNVVENDLANKDNSTSSTLAERVDPNTTTYYEKNSPEVLTRVQLIELFEKLKSRLNVSKDRLTVGMVGYPNVGKSSTINALMTVKKVSVSATPGKTKHFQTLVLNDSLSLCDCPGLVLPSFVCTKGDMVVHGILPLDQMREYMEPMTILCECIGGRKAAERKLGILLPPSPEDKPDYLSPRDLLLAYAYSRGMMSGAGTPDCARAARTLLRSSCQGKLSIAIPPPGTSMESFRENQDSDEKAAQTRDMTPQEKRALKSGDTPEDLDNTFFQRTGLAAHAKGVQGKFSGLPKVRVRTVNGSALHETPVEGKPWKYFNKHANKKKKEKLRRVYAHLDQH